MSIKRNASDTEMSILNMLINIIDNPLKKTLKSQLNALLVREIDTEKSLILYPRETSNTNGNTGAVAEGSLENSEGHMIYFVLHIFEDNLHELEIFKDNFEPIVEDFDLSKITVYRK